jgi:predicted  nucleic acid-binding Zn-ribbon protein
VTTWNLFRMPATLDQILNAINSVNRKLDVLMSQQDELNTDVQAVQQAVDDLGTAATDIEAEIAALKSSNPALDLSGLDAKVAALKNAVSGVTSIAAPAAPPAS